ncbi:MAG: immunoglobulin domain-containing protein [Phycisphaerales bacterium]
MPLPAPTTATARATAHVLAAGLALSLSAAAALATPVEIRSATTVGPLDTTIESSDGTIVPLVEAEIMVIGTTLTINGRHDIVSLAIDSTAVVTHDAGFIFDYSGGTGTDVIYGFDLATSGDVVIEFGGRIIVDGRGFAGDEGPGAGALDPDWAGGGAYGGEGGRSARNAPGGLPYGSVFEPVLFGSGGGTSLAGPLGRPGGGSIRLTVGGTLLHNGIIEADGNSISAGEGAGAGGSIWIDATNIAGTLGIIRANGGNGNVSVSGAGSGGRVAVYSDGLIPPVLIDQLNAFGGDGWADGIFNGDGAAGTVYVSQAGNATLIIDNNGRNGRITPLNDVDAFATPFDGNVIVRGQGKIGPAEMEVLDLHILGNLTVERDGFITADGRGFGADEGPGAGVLGAPWGGGAGHGGEGGRSARSASSGGTSYGSVFEPIDFGSGGGTSVGEASGRPGGGAIKLVVDGTLRVDGVIEADGLSQGSAGEGGGAGGSIWIDAASFTGATGTIRANGGNGNISVSGAGSGGRIAVYSGTALPRFFSDRINAYGGDGWGEGILLGDAAAGTVLLSEAGQATLIIDNGGRNGRMTTMSDTDVFAEPFDGDVIVRNRGYLGPKPMEPLEMDVLGDVTIAEFSYITATGRGFGANQGPGGGEQSLSWGGGGAHGGQGGNGAGGLGGEAYGSILEPTTRGSGGGTFIGGGQGEPGGGAIRLFVGGTLFFEGFIDANGLSQDTDREGGGAGGSVWIRAPRIAGTTGTIRANGGNGNVNGSGAGSGGRIAVYVDSPLPPLFDERFFARGGGGWGSGILQGDGAAGTVLIEEDGDGRLIINNGVDGRITTIGSNNPEVDGDGRFALDVPVDVTGFARLGPQQGEFVHFDFGGDVTIAGSAEFTASGMGFPTDQGPGAGTAGRTWGGGGGHGGAGGNGRSDDPEAIGGGSYGIDTFPTTLGSGGGRDPDSDIDAGAGGGAFRLSVGGTLMLDGPVLADGISGRGEQAGGGSGGSIWIDANAITGTNGVFARGGTGPSAGGGGGGGYIAIYSCLVSPSVTASAAGGGSGSGERGEDGRTLFGSTSVDITTQPPAEQTLAPGSALNLSVNAIGSGSLSYQWRFDGEPLVDDGRISGSTTSSLRITSLTEDDAGRYDVLVSDACGPFPSQSSVLIVDDTCRADFDGDGELTLFDFLAFSNAFDAGDPRADFDGDGSLTLFDFLTFSNEFDAGCP